MTVEEMRAEELAEDMAWSRVIDAKDRRGPVWVAQAVEEAMHAPPKNLAKVSREAQRDSVAELARALGSMPEWVFREDYETPVNPAGVALRETMLRMIDRIRSLLVGP